MTKNEILDELFRSDEFDKMLLKVMRTDSIFFEDFKQDLFLILCKIPARTKAGQGIEDMHEKCELDFFVFRIIRNQIRSETSPFFRTYKKNRDKHHKYDLEENDLVTELKDEKFNILKYSNENRILSWYETEIMSQYYGLGRFSDRGKVSYRALEESLGIDHVSLRNTVAEAVEKIRIHLKTNEEK